ncbi:DUF537-domain-containing protein [Phlegmacium glaucopus]|nr:DUF537-domain-containing protein [Phlegmacium glaucopus]
MKDTDEVAVFWDYENCPAPSNTSGYAIVNNIRSVAQTFGSVKLFKAYLEVTEQVPVSRAQVLRSELQSSGVSLTDCPHNGRKDVADKMIIVDMLAHAIDNPAPSTIVLISGDRDFAYALSILRLRRYRVVLITLSNAHPSLRVQASLCFDWISDVLEPVDSTMLHQLTSPYRGKTSLPPTHDKFYSDPKGHNHSRFPSQESHDEKSTNVEIMDYIQDQTRRREISRTPPRTPPRRDGRHDFLPPDLEQPKGQPAPSCVASSVVLNRPESPARVIHTPVASSCHINPNGSIETSLTVTARDSNSSRTTLTPNTSAGSTPKLATYGSIMPSRSSTHFNLRGSSSLPNLQYVAASVPELASFPGRILPTEPDLRGPSPSSQQGTSSPINTKTQSPSGIDQIDGDSGDPDPLPTYSDISPHPNVFTPPSAPAPTLMLPSSLSNITAPAATQSPVKAANPPQPTSFPVVPDKFKVLVQCLKSYRAKGTLRPLRSNVAVQIASNGTTYRQAGVLKFKQYVTLAVKAGIVEVGGSEATAFIVLREPWCNVPSP